MNFLSILPFVSTGMNLINSVIGHEQDRKSLSIQQDINNQNYLAQQEFNQQQYDIAMKNIALQKEFAQQGVSWRIADAKNAGIHPLAALGVNPVSFSPVHVGGDAPRKNMLNMGQNLQRALSAMATPMEKYRNYLTIQQEQEKLKNMKLANVGLAKQIAESNNKPMVDSDGVIVGQGNSITETDLITGLTKTYPANGRWPKPTGYTYNETKVPYSSQTGFQAGSDPYFKYSIGPHGEKIPVLSDPNEEKIESMNMRQYIQDMQQIHRQLGGLWYKYAPKFLQPEHHRKKYYKNLEAFRPKDGVPRYYDPWTDSWYKK